MKHQPCRILVIDDMPSSTRLLDVFLSHRGYEVRTVNDSRAAIQAALDFQPEVVLLDISMPYLNGYEVAQLIRQQPEIGSVPIVAITSHDDEAHFQHAADVGIGHQITKPCNLSNLENLIGQHCD